jgi:hypothetical protein
MKLFWIKANITTRNFETVENIRKMENKDGGNLLFSPLTRIIIVLICNKITIK